MNEGDMLPKPMLSSIHLPVAVSWQEIQKRASAAAVGKVIEKSPVKITIKDLVIWEEFGLIKVQVQTQGTYDGTIKVSTRPVFNKVANKFEFNDLKLDMAAESFLQKGAVFLLRGVIERQIEKILDRSLDEPIREFTAKANEQLKSFKPMPNVDLDGELKDFKLVDFGYDDKGVMLSMAAEGMLAVRVV